MAQSSDFSPEPAGSQSQGAPGRPPVILLVDDDTSVRKLVTRFLTMSGFQILAAESGPKAIPIWRDCKESIDLLLTDMVMPEGISGLDLAQLFQTERPSLRVLFTSGYDVEITDASGALRSGLHFVQKPYRPEQLLAAVRTALAARPSPVEALC